MLTYVSTILSHNAAGPVVVKSI